MLFDKNKVMHTSKHAKLIKSLLILAVVVLFSGIFAFTWQKYDDSKHPDGNEKNYSLPNAFVEFVEIVGNFIEEHSTKNEEYIYVTETDANGVQKVVRIVVGKDDNSKIEQEEEIIEPIIIEDHGGVCSKISRQSEESFNNTLFIGDYFAYNVSQYCFKNARYAYVSGYDLNYMLNKRLFSVDGSYVTFLEYIKTFSDAEKIYLTFSAESISWMDTPTFVLKYESFLNSVMSIFPDSTIYVMPILPINEEMAAKREYTVTNEKINEINSYIINMALDKELWYLDITEEFKDTEGKLPEEYTTNGIRLNDVSTKIFKEYILTHGKVLK